MSNFFRYNFSETVYKADDHEVQKNPGKKKLIIQKQKYVL